MKKEEEQNQENQTTYQTVENEIKVTKSEVSISKIMEVLKGESYYTAEKILRDCFRRISFDAVIN